jgi:hypothetical protein
MNTINGFITKLELRDNPTRPIHEFIAEVRGVITKEQFVEYREQMIRRGKVEIVSWDENDPAFGIRIIMQLEKKQL